MSRPVPAGDYVAHFDPQLDHHRAWLLAVLEQLVVNELGPWTKVAACGSSGASHRRSPSPWRQWLQRLQ